MVVEEEEEEEEEESLKMGKKYRRTRCPKAIHGHRYPCPTSDFSFFVIFCVSRAAAPEGTGGDGVLTIIF